MYFSLHSNKQVILKVRMQISSIPTTNFVETKMLRFEKLLRFLRD